MSSPIHTYVIVRKDLTVEQQTIQMIHAAQEAAYRYPSDMSRPHHLVTLEVENEQELMRTMVELQVAGIKYYEFEEPDLPNHLGHASFTAIASEPLTDHKKRAFFKKYPLWKASEVLTLTVDSSAIRAAIDEILSTTINVHTGEQRAVDPSTASDDEFCQETKDGFCLSHKTDHGD